MLNIIYDLCNIPLTFLPLTFRWYNRRDFLGRGLQQRRWTASKTFAIFGENDTLRRIVFEIDNIPRKRYVVDFVIQSNLLLYQLICILKSSFYFVTNILIIYFSLHSLAYRWRCWLESDSRENKDKSSTQICQS